MNAAKETCDWCGGEITDTNRESHESGKCS